MDCWFWTSLGDCGGLGLTLVTFTVSEPDRRVGHLHWTYLRYGWYTYRTGLVYWTTLTLKRCGLFLWGLYKTASNSQRI